jgi:shikimate kinase
MGSGKTTVGRILAKRLGWTFLDTDRQIQNESGMTIAEIFSERGEERFRELESEVAAGLAGLSGRVIATGGGFMLRSENLRRALEAGRVFFLVASAEEIWHRVRRKRNRPLLEVDDPEARIRELLAEREAAYRAIPERVATDGRSPEAIADEIYARLTAS